MKSRTSMDFGQIRTPSSELQVAALEHLKKSPEFEFSPDLTTDYGVSMFIIFLGCY